MNSERNECFVLRPKAKCGDFEVNSDEECDAGSDEISSFVDPCCEATGSDRECRFKEGIQCHPREGMIDSWAKLNPSISYKIY